MEYYVRKYVITYVEDLKYKDREWRKLQKGTKCDCLQWGELDNSLSNSSFVWAKRVIILVIYKLNKDKTTL